MKRWLSLFVEAARTVAALALKFHVAGLLRAAQVLRIRLSGGMWGAMLVLCSVSACSFAPTWSPMPMPDTLTRQEIEQFRSREEDRLQTALRECYQRFAVNDCRREAMTRHNEVQHQLRAQELRLNALDREVRQRKLQADPSVQQPDAISPTLGQPNRTGSPP
jgi:hypothetical protein